MRVRCSVLALIAASLIATATAVAKPYRVVVLEFDGPRQLAGAGRAAVIAALDMDSIISAKTWADAQAHASGHGPDRWREASEQARVDAVLEGWVQQEGGSYVLTIAVRDASTGAEVDTISLRIKPTGVTTVARHKLENQLDAMLATVGETSGPAAASSRTSDPESSHHARASGRDLPKNDDDVRSRRQIQSDAAKVDADKVVADKVVADKVVANTPDGADASIGAPKGDRTTGRTDVFGGRGDGRSTQTDRNTKVAERDASERDASEHDASERDKPSDDDASHDRGSQVAVQTPRFEVRGGPYAGARGMVFANDPDASGPPASYPAALVAGLAAELAIFPLPLQTVGGRLSGVGVTAEFKRSVGAKLSAMDDAGTGYHDYTLKHLAWETAIHYRYLIDQVTLDGSANLGNVSHTRSSGFPESIAIPDTSYSYVGVGAHVDYQPIALASFGAGAQYMRPFRTGMVTEPSWYGPGTANGVTLDGNVVITLPRNLYVEASLEYRRIEIDLNGSGDEAMAAGVFYIVDSSVLGSAMVGTQF